MSKLNNHEKVMELTKKIVPSMRYDGKQDFSVWQSEARKKLCNLIGLDKFEKCEDKLQIEYTKETQEYTETRFLFQSEEGYFVPCHLRVPTGADKPLPVVICLQGHSTGMHISLGNPKFEGDEQTIKGGDRAFAERIIKEGFCALAIEQRHMGECGGNEKGPQCYIPSMADLLIGRTVIGERVWDIQRAIDVLEKHFPQIDKNKVMCMGNSGGGTTTFYAACVDERICAAMPSCAVASFDDSIAAMSHCSCNFVPGIRNYFDMCDLGAIIAPRPLVIVTGKEDPIFPVDSAKKMAAYIKDMYEKANASERFAHVIGEGGHRFYADDSWPVMHSVIKGLV